MAITTTTATAGWRPDTTTYSAGDAVPDALILANSTIAGEVDGDAPAVRVAYVVDAPAGFVPEGADITPADPSTPELLIYTGRISQLIKISTEQWNQPGSSDLLAQSVRRAVTKAADVAFIRQANPTAPAVTPPGGLLNAAGIATAAAALSGDLDGLVDLIAAVESNGATPSAILIDPLGWATLAKIKTATDSNAALLGAGVEATERRLLGLPVTVSPALPARTGLVIDNEAILSVIGQVEVATSSDFYFNSSAIAIRATWRFGAKPIHPNRIGTFTVAE